jgi:hypothetical protein
MCIPQNWNVPYDLILLHFTGSDVQDIYSIIVIMFAKSTHMTFTQNKIFAFSSFTSEQIFSVGGITLTTH